MDYSSAHTIRLAIMVLMGVFLYFYLRYRYQKRFFQDVLADLKENAYPPSKITRKMYDTIIAVADSSISRKIESLYTPSGDYFVLRQGQDDLGSSIGPEIESLLDRWASDKPEKTDSWRIAEKDFDLADFLRGEKGSISKLLLLRAYGIGDSFQEDVIISKRWLLERGPVFAIMDQLFAKYDMGNEGLSKFSSIFRKNIVKAVINGSLIASVFSNLCLFALSEIVRESLPAIIYIIAIIIFGLIPQAILVHRFVKKRYTNVLGTTFMHNLSIVDSMLNASTEKNGLFGLYSLYSFYCPNSLWKMALDELVHNCDHILMDFRGITSDRVGCRFELKYVLENIASENITILVDQVSDIEFLSVFLNKYVVQETNSSVTFYRFSGWDR